MIAGGPVILGGPQVLVLTTPSAKQKQDQRLSRRKRLDTFGKHWKYEQAQHWEPWKKTQEKRYPKVLQSLSELPAECWVEVQNDQEGTQFHTKVDIGAVPFEMMLDGGSGVNSVTEELVLWILNDQAKKGVPLSDRRHPIKRLEKWPMKEELRGIAGGKNVELVGSVVLRIMMVELGKKTGPDVLFRFKICKKGMTEWVGLIIGARAIDCPERGGL